MLVDLEHVQKRYLTLTLTLSQVATREADA